jgi:hypothetical protein
VGLYNWNPVERWLDSTVLALFLNPSARTFVLVL